MTYNKCPECNSGGIGTCYSDGIRQEDCHRCGWEIEYVPEWISKGSDSDIHGLAAFFSGAVMALGIAAIGGGIIAVVVTHLVGVVTYFTLLAIFGE